MNFRTDLALERKEYIDRHDLDGIVSHRKTVDGITVDTITVTNKEGEKILGKPIGKYITVETVPFTKNSDLFSPSLYVLRDELKSLLPEEKGCVLVAGLGNGEITPDALGPKCISMLFATRHIPEDFAREIGFSSIRPVAGIIPGVLGKTGMESSEIISGIVKKINPCAVIVIDALASRSTDRLGRTVQISDSGISPGSGVGNHRKTISEKSLGVPVIAIGVPTVVDGRTLAFDILKKAGVTEEQINNTDIKDTMMVTPKEIDELIERASRLIAMAINTALHPEINEEDILSVVS
ncbi:MAG: GPR endopeptidase [Clostridia bacterium]|nr:GPR endopeptidase [Clostridia bacterium]